MADDTEGRWMEVRFQGLLPAGADLILTIFTEDATEKLAEVFGFTGLAHLTVSEGKSYQGTGHRDIPDEAVKRAQLYDHEHWRADRDGERGGSWGSVPADQVRRLLWGAYGELLATAAAIREGLEAAERGETEDLGSFAEYADEEG